MKNFEAFSGLFAIFICFSTVQSHAIRNQAKIVIDHDGGADDAMAIFIALLREKYFLGPELVAISTVHGNVNETQAFENTQRILTVAERPDIPIYRGSTNALIRDYPQDNYFGIDGLGDSQDVHYFALRAQPQHSVNALIYLSKIYKGQLIVVAIGPLTNIALAMKLDPDFLGRLKHLYVGGSNIEGPSFPKPEFNALLDVEAYYIMAKNANPDKVTVVPFSESVLSMPIPSEWRLNTLGAINTKIMKEQNQFEAVSLPKGPVWTFLDPFVSSLALDPNVIAKQVCVNNNITLCGPKRGINTNNFTSDEPNIKLVTAGAEEYYKQFLIDTFSAELQEYYPVNYEYILAPTVLKEVDYDTGV